VIVLDASVVLAGTFNEPGAEVLLAMDRDTAISVVNLGEVVTKLTERAFADDEINALIQPFREISRALTETQAFQAGLWRRETRKFGLSMGDRCCLALAKELGAEVYTTERVWAQLDLGVKVRVVR